MRFSKILTSAFLIVAIQSPFNAFGAEVSLRTPMGVRNFEIQANSNESTDEVSALAALARKLDQSAGYLNQAVSSTAPTVGYPNRGSGSIKSTDAFAKNVPDSTSGQIDPNVSSGIANSVPHPTFRQVFDHNEETLQPVYQVTGYENQIRPVYRTEQVDESGAAR
jgi:hypothetical protein